MKQDSLNHFRSRCRQTLLPSLLLSILSASVTLAQRPRTDAPSTERLRAHISHLSSNKLEGRRTGTSGARLAAEYIANEFARYGLMRSVGVDRPGMSILEADSPRRYMQEFPYVATPELGKGNTLSVRSRPDGVPLDLRLGEDWMPLGFSSNQQINNLPAVFVRYGIAATDLQRDDYAGVDVKNRSEERRVG